MKTVKISFTKLLNIFFLTLRKVYSVSTQLQSSLGKQQSFVKVRSDSHKLHADSVVLHKLLSDDLIAICL